MSPIAFVEANSSILLITAMALAAISVILLLVVLFELRRLKKPFREMAALYGEIGTEKALEKLLKGVDENREYIRRHGDDLKVVFKRLDGSYRGMGIVKYNAFEDVGGMQSYSLCILNREKNGFMLTNLVGRNSTRGYAIEIKDGNPSRELSGEEREAFGYCLKSLDE